MKEKSKNSKCTFHGVDNEKIIKEIKRLNKNKVSQIDIFADFLAESLKGAIKTYNLSNCLKLADITPLHKKGREDNKENYRMGTILSTLSKISERILFEQISVYFDKVLSGQQCGFRKEYSTQHCLLNLLEKWKNSALLTDLSKALIVSIMNYLLQNSTHMDLLYPHYD